MVGYFGQWSRLPFASIILMCTTLAGTHEPIPSTAYSISRTWHENVLAFANCRCCGRIEGSQAAMLLVMRIRGGRSDKFAKKQRLDGGRRQRTLYGSESDEHDDIGKEQGIGASKFNLPDAYAKGEVLSDYDAGDVSLEAKPANDDFEANEEDVSMALSNEEMVGNWWDEISEKVDGQGGWATVRAAADTQDAREAMGVAHKQKKEQPAWKRKKLEAKERIESEAKKDKHSSKNVESINNAKEPDPEAGARTHRQKSTQSKMDATRRREAHAARDDDDSIKRDPMDMNEELEENDDEHETIGKNAKESDLLARALASSVEEEDEDGSHQQDLGDGDEGEGEDDFDDLDDDELFAEGEGEENSEDERVRAELARLAEDEKGGDADGGTLIDESGHEATVAGHGEGGKDDQSRDEYEEDDRSVVEEETSQYDSEADCRQVLTEQWTKEDDDSEMIPLEAGRRCFTRDLLEKLTSDLNITIHTDYEEKDPNQRFWTKPTVYLEGANVMQLEERLPLGFFLRKEADTVAVLVRHRTPPPFDEVDSEEEAEKQKADAWREEPTRPDHLYEAGNITEAEFRSEVRKRIIWLKARAADGDVMACIELGDRMLEGNGTKKDAVMGCKWMMEAAAAGHSYAQFVVARCFQLGEGVEADPKQAVDWYKLAAKDRADQEGELEAKHNVAVSYDEGIGIPKDYVLACAWYKKAAALGCMESQHNLALHYAEGKGVRTHERKAAYWFLQAAKQGCGWSAFFLGVRYIKGKGTRKDMEQGLKWLRKSSHRGIGNATELLDLLRNGTMPDKVDALLRAADERPEDSLSREYSGNFIAAHKEMVDTLRRQLEVSSKRAEAYKARAAVSPIADQVPKRLGKRVADAYAEAQLEALRALSKQGIRTGAMDMARKEAMEAEDDMEWAES